MLGFRSEGKPRALSYNHSPPRLKYRSIFLWTVAANRPALTVSTSAATPNRNFLDTSSRENTIHERVTQRRQKRMMHF